MFVIIYLPVGEPVCVLLRTTHIRLYLWARQLCCSRLPALAPCTLEEYCPRSSLEDRTEELWDSCIDFISLASYCTMLDVPSNT